MVLLSNVEIGKDNVVEIDVDQFVSSEPHHGLKGQRVSRYDRVTLDDSKIRSKAVRKTSKSSPPSWCCWELDNPVSEKNLTFM